MSKLTRDKAIIEHTAAVDLTGRLGYPVMINTNGEVFVTDEPNGTPCGVLLTEGKAGDPVSVAHFGCGGTVKVRIAGAAPTAPGQLLAFADPLDGAVTFGPQADAMGSNAIARAIEGGNPGDLIEAVLYTPRFTES